jgi:hypothetical protein
MPMSTATDTRVRTPVSVVAARMQARLARLDRWSSDSAARTTALLMGLGFLAACITVWAAGRVGTVSATAPLSTWFGLLSRDGVSGNDYLPGSVLLAGIAALILLWLAAIRLLGGRGSRERRVWWVAGAWSLPFVVGPPLFSSDVYTYAAQGIMVQHGFDPYRVGPSVLGYVPAVAAVDPSWRSVPSPYGPIATSMEHLAATVSGGSPLGAVLVLRALAVLSVVAIGVLAAALARTHRSRALTLTVLNPLVLLQVVSAAHFEGAMCAFLLAALVAADRRRWALAIVLGSFAGSVKAPAFVVVLAVIVVHSAVRHGRAAWRPVARDLLITVLTTGTLSLLVSNGLGWIDALRTPTLGYTRFAPTSLIGDLLGQIVRPAPFDDVATAARAVALLAAGCIVGYLLLTARKRPLNQTVGLGLMAVGLLSPVVYPWYLLWGLVCLVPTARGIGRNWLVFAGCIGAVASALGLPSQGENAAVLVAAFVGACVVVPPTLRAARSLPHRPPLHGPKSLPEFSRTRPS